MCIWKWCVEGYVILGIVALITLGVIVRGCSDFNIEDNKLNAQTDLAKITAGLEQCPKTGYKVSETIWVKDCPAYLTTRGIKDDD